MNFYELVIIVRPDLSTSEVDNIVDNITSIVAESHEGELIKNEYWGMRHLAYEINNNKKGHYVLLGLSTPKPGLNELERRIKLNENIIRFMIIKVDELSKDLSPILKSKELGSSTNINVTSIQPKEVSINS
jgi:small subunit ribosomal protein S6